MRFIKECRWEQWHIKSRRNESVCGHTFYSSRCVEESEGDNNICQKCLDLYLGSPSEVIDNPFPIFVPTGEE